MKKNVYLLVSLLCFLCGCDKQFSNAKSLFNYLSKKIPVFSADVTITSGEYLQTIKHKQNKDFTLDESNFYESHKLHGGEEIIFPCFNYDTDFQSYNLINLKNNYFYVWGCVAYQTGGGSSRPATMIIEYDKYDQNTHGYEIGYPNPNRITIGKNITSFNATSFTKNDATGTCTYTVEGLSISESGEPIIKTLKYELCDFKLHVESKSYQLSLILPNNIFSSEKSEVKFTFTSFKKPKIDLDAYNSFVPSKKSCSVEI